MAKITIDGIELEVPDGTLVLEAAKKLGIEIPNFCYYPKLALIGACRMCLVEVEGAPKPMASCTTTVREGMVVHTTSPAVQKLRRGMLEFLLLNHSLTCPTCDMGGECELQDQVFRYASGRSRLQDPKVHRGINSLGPFIDKNMERCVQCARCIRYCDEIMGNSALAFTQRGVRTEVSSFMDADLDCVLCGNCVEVCPVGALTSNLFDDKARGWDRNETRTLCDYCSDGCSLKLDVQSGEVLRTRAFLESGILLSQYRGVNEEFLCIRGRYGYQFINNPERLRHPHVRVGTELKQATWPDALNAAASGLKRILAEHGPQAVGAIGSERWTNEEAYLYQKLVRTVLGTNNLDHRVGLKRLSEEPRPAKSTPSLARLREAKAILVLGTDISDENPLTETMVRQAIRKRGAALVLADSRIPLIGMEASHHLRCKPGTEPFLALGIAEAVSGAKGLALPADLASAVSGAAGRVTEVCGISAEELQAAAQALVSAPQAFVLYGQGLLQAPGGREAALVLRRLAAAMEWPDALVLSGSSNSRGAADMGVLPTQLPGYQPVADAAARARLAELWGAEVPSQPGLDTGGMLRAAAEGRLRALLVFGSNPLVSYPDGDLVRRALESVELLVVADLFATDTAKLAHVVLPAASFAEKDGTFTNVECRVQRVRRALEPLPDSKPDSLILAGLARAMGAAWDFPEPEELFAELQTASGLFSGTGYADLEMGGFQWTERAEQDASAPALSAAGLEAPKAPVGYPFLLLAGTILYHHGTLSQYATGPNLAAPGSYVQVSPGDAASLGVEAGDIVALESRTGRLELPVEVTDKVSDGSVFVPINFPQAPANRLRDAGSAFDYVSVTKVASRSEGGAGQPAGEAALR
ncbi:MAG TPA: NADH-quinone oxidoreductase subunit NuoG [Armatimonadota bacterium]|jgi:formate dehydrogenase alpha subunit